MTFIKFIIILLILCFSIVECKSKIKRTKVKDDINLNSNWAKTRPCRIQIGASNVSYEINFGNNINKPQIHGLDINKILVKNTLSISYENKCYYSLTYCRNEDLVDCRKIGGFLIPGEEKDLFSQVAFRIKSFTAKNYIQRLECLDKCGITIDGRNFKGCGGEVSSHFDQNKIQNMKMWNTSGLNCACRVKVFTRADFEGTRGNFVFYSEANFEKSSKILIKSFWHDCVNSKLGKNDYFYPNPPQ